VYSTIEENDWKEKEEEDTKRSKIFDSAWHTVNRTGQNRGQKQREDD
jgi:hypothetical protein